MNKAVEALRVISDHLARRGVFYRDAEITELLKTVNGYRNALRRAVYAFYNNRIGQFEFVDRLEALTRDQLSRAYREGLRSAGFDPKDMTSRMMQELDTIINNEETYILELGSYILENKEKDPRPPSTIFQPRIDIRAQRYTDTVNRGALAGSKEDDLFEWVLGATDHCSTCMTLAGDVATKEEWLESGYRPQDPPNNQLECGGWRCQCELVPTDKNHTGVSL